MSMIYYLREGGLQVVVSAQLAVAHCSVAEGFLVLALCLLGFLVLVAKLSWFGRGNGGVVRSCARGDLLNLFFLVYVALDLS